MKLDTYALGSKLKNLGFEFYSGIPCSSLNNLINYAINEVTFVMSSNEGDAVSTCFGASLAGKKSVVLMQNSGLTNATSPLTSLNYPFKMPILGFVSLRGEPGIKDEPQHELMGTITEKMLELMQIQWEYLATDIKKVTLQLERANHAIENNQSFFFVVKKGTLDNVDLKPQDLKFSSNEKLELQKHDNEMPTRLNVLEHIGNSRDNNTLLLATTGKSGRELYELEDTKNNLYMVGSMGCISSIGLGLTMVQKNKKVIAIDGDGALMMRMGNLASNAYYSPNNLLHILIDNNMHDSTGGQFTASHNVNFVQIAASSGYVNSFYVHSLEELSTRIKEWTNNPVLTFIQIKVQKGTKPNLGRPSIKPHEVKERLMEFISDQ